jgi:ubiquinone/menaquinone biosynthesis C-methylase UbiE
MLYSDSQGKRLLRVIIWFSRLRRCQVGAFGAKEIKLNELSSRNFDSFAELYETFVTLISGTPWLGWADIAGEKAIDIGCGAGQTTEILAKKFGRVIGIDISDELIKLAKAKHAANNISYI